jgi:hypothetical protein
VIAREAIRIEIGTKRETETEVENVLVTAKRNPEPQLLHLQTTWLVLAVAQPLLRQNLWISVLL